MSDYYNTGEHVVCSIGQITINNKLTTVKKPDDLDAVIKMARNMHDRAIVLDLKKRLIFANSKLGPLANRYFDNIYLLAVSLEDVCYNVWEIVSTIEDTYKKHKTRHATARLIHSDDCMDICSMPLLTSTGLVGVLVVAAGG